MNTYYRQSRQVTIPDNFITECNCGEASGILIDLDAMIITCDACYENAAWHERYTDVDILSMHGVKLASNMYDFWNETYIINHDQSLTHL